MAAATGCAGPVSPLHTAAAVLLLRGAGAATVKSLALLPVSVQPPALRRAAVVFDRAAVGLPSVGVALPKLTMSTTAPPLGAVPDSALALLASATLPPVAAIMMVPARSPGTSTVPPLPA